jgi:hypothetical protein
MAPKWKAFAIWVALPYLSYETVIPGLLLLFRHDVTLPPSLRNLATVLATCAGLAAFGTTAIWMLPIRRGWVGIISGLILAITGIVLWALFEMALFGGFEEDAGIYVTAVSLVVPSCLAGAYAGLLRSRESQSQVRLERKA